MAADIAALKSEGLIWALPSVDVGGDDVLYPREERPLIRVDPDVAALWHEVTVRYKLILLLPLFRHVEPCRTAVQCPNRYLFRSDVA